MSDNCCMVQERRIVFTAADVNKFQQILEHGCKCGSCCRRVAVWSETPVIGATDDWTVKLLAKVNFGCQRWCGGSLVEIDIKKGVILDLIGDYISVDIGAIEIVTGLEGSIIPEITIGAMSACCGAGAARGCATRTTASITVDSNALGTIPIPPYAYAVQFLPSPAGASFYVSTTAIVFSGSGSGAVMFTTTGDIVPDPLMIPNGAENIGIINTGLDPLVFEVIFLIGV